jgi:long-subunit acyl-CoA synthetase (AMP-forming)
LIDRCEKTLGCQVFAGYGLSETCPVATSARHKSATDSADNATRLKRQAMA